MGCPGYVGGVDQTAGKNPDHHQEQPKHIKGGRMAATPEGVGGRMGDVILCLLERHLKEEVLCQTGEQQTVRGGCTLTRPSHRGQGKKLVGQGVDHEG